MLHRKLEVFAESLSDYLKCDALANTISWKPFHVFYCCDSPQHVFFVPMF